MTIRENNAAIKTRSNCAVQLRVSRCPETVLSEANYKHFWASEFSTILVPQKIGILGRAGILGRRRKRVPKHLSWYIADSIVPVLHLIA